MPSRSTSTGSRPSTSSTSTGRSCVVRPESPLTSSASPGSVLTGSPARLCRLDDLAPHLAGGGRHRDQHLVRPPVADQLRQVGRRAEHADPVQAQVALARIVVDDPDRRVAEARVPQHLLDHELRGVAGPDDDRLLAAGHDLPRERPLDQRPGEQARPGDERETEEQVDEPDARSARAPDGARRG